MENEKTKYKVNRSFLMGGEIQHQGDEVLLTPEEHVEVVSKVSEVTKQESVTQKQEVEIDAVKVTAKNKK